MTFQLTESQQQVVDSRGETHVRAIDARNNAVYVLMPETDFLRLQEMLEEEAQHAAIYEMAKRNALAKTLEEKRQQKVIAKVALQNAIELTNKVP
ncbi:MAG: hypothetical protein EXS16_14820 [Gemmataceae bacterium]|nr:hypothetical protein [Gemmataceae bacterium]